jgi:hypothetical protein
MEDDKPSVAPLGVKSAIAFAFALLYLSAYPVVTGGFVIHKYPYWPPAVAAAYVLGGVAVQVWFVLRRDGSPGTQIVVGILYAAALPILPGGLYMT